MSSSAQGSHPSPNSLTSTSLPVSATPRLFVPNATPAFSHVPTAVTYPTPDPFQQAESPWPGTQVAIERMEEFRALQPSQPDLPSPVDMLGLGMGFGQPFQQVAPEAFDASLNWSDPGGSASSTAGVPSILPLGYGLGGPPGDVCSAPFDSETCGMGPFPIDGQAGFVAQLNHPPPVDPPALRPAAGMPDADFKRLLAALTGDLDDPAHAITNDASASWELPTGVVLADNSATVAPCPETGAAVPDFDLPPRGQGPSAALGQVDAGSATKMAILGSSAPTDPLPQVFLPMATEPAATSEELAVPGVDEMNRAGEAGYLDLFTDPAAHARQAVPWDAYQDEQPGAPQEQTESPPLTIAEATMGPHPFSHEPALTSTAIDTNAGVEMDSTAIFPVLRDVPAADDESVQPKIYNGENFNELVDAMNNGEFGNVDAFLAECLDEPLPTTQELLAMNFDWPQKSAAEDESSASGDEDTVDTSLCPPLDVNGIMQFITRDQRFDLVDEWTIPKFQYTMWKLRKRLTEKGLERRIKRIRREKDVEFEASGDGIAIEPRDQQATERDEIIRRDHMMEIGEPIGSRGRPTTPDHNPEIPKNHRRPPNWAWREGQRLTPPRSGMPTVPMRTRDPQPDHGVSSKQGKSRDPRRSKDGGETRSKQSKAIASGTKCPDCQRTYDGLGWVRENNAGSSTEGGVTRGSVRGGRLSEAIDLTLDSE